METEVDESLVLTKDTILELIVSFAFIDGELHPKEAEALESVCQECAIPSQRLESKIEEHRHKTEDRENICYRAFEAIDSQYARERLVGPLIQIATADGVHHQRELRFLNAIKEKWNLKISVGKEFVWDESQKAVIQTDYNERMIVDAGPGMGKTAVACARVSELIDQNVEPNNIWILSFTRTAVKEVNDRISCFLDHDVSALGIKITTIDSKAWRMRYGLTGSEIKSLFGNFDQNIEEAIRIFDEKKDEVYENFCNLEHVIIDEAQDIMGARAELLIRILKCLNENCGFTIFADPAQAIYGFTDDRDGIEKEDTSSFLDCVKKEFKNNLQEKELKKIHRTKNSNLINLVDNLRLDIYLNDNVDESCYDERGEFIREHADKETGVFSSDELVGKDNKTLVLFRRRSEVLRASYFACKDRIAHRIRMSEHSSGIFSWIGFVFYDYLEQIISKERFFEICNQRVNLFEIPTDTLIWESWWTLLLSIAKKNDSVNVTQLRTILSRNRPPINFCYPDTGNVGPILGTIHASKGREANNVVLKLPFKPAKAKKFNYDEESRVLYVGATRAREELTVGKGFVKQRFAKSLESSRAYSCTRKDSDDYRLAAVEIGLDGDLNEFSVVSKKRPLQDVMEFQRKMTKLAKEPPSPLIATRRKYGDEYIYEIWTHSEGKDIDKVIGEFNASFNRDLFKIACSFGKFNTPGDIRRSSFYMLGLRTVCKSENDIGLKAVHEPYSETGFWVVPTLIGYPSCFFPARRQKRYR